MPLIDSLFEWVPALSDRYGNAFTSVGLGFDPGGPGGRLLVGLDDPALPRYAQAVVLPPSSAGDPLQPLVGSHLGLNVGLRASARPVMYFAGPFRQQALTINIYTRGVGGEPVLDTKAAAAAAWEIAPSWCAPMVVGAGGVGSMAAVVRVGGRWTHALTAGHVISLPPERAPVYARRFYVLTEPSQDLSTAADGLLDRFLLGREAREARPDTAVGRMTMPLQGPTIAGAAGAIRGFAQPVDGSTACLWGRTSSRGVVGPFPSIVVTPYGPSRHLVRADYASYPGDSGGLVYEDMGGSARALGVHVGRENDFAYFLPIDPGLPLLAATGIDAARGVACAWGRDYRLS